MKQKQVAKSTAPAGKDTKTEDSATALQTAGITRLNMDDIEEVMASYRKVAQTDLVEAFSTLIKVFPNEHMIAQLALLGQPVFSIGGKLS